MSERSTELTVVDRTTGEIIDLKSAETARLAEFVTNLNGLRKELAEAESVASDELVARMDHEALYTLHVEDGNRRWEIKGSSPTAGPTVYVEDMLESELEGLVRGGIISPDAAARALHRRVVLELGVPWDADPRVMARQVREAPSIEVGGVVVKVERAEARTTPIASSINALRKVPGSIDALDRAQKQTAPPHRRATVKLKGEDRD